MAENDMLKRYLEAGMAFTQMTRSRAEAIVKDLVHAGEVQREQTQDRVEEIIERSRKNTDALLELVRKEIRTQLNELGIRARSGSAAARKPAAKTASAVASVKKAAGGATKKATAAKKTVKKAAVKKTSATKKKAAGAKSATKKAAKKA